MQILFYLTTSITGMLFLKLSGKNGLMFSTQDNTLNFKIKFLAILGFTFAMVSFILWQKLLSNFPLSLILPITTGITLIFGLLADLLFFKEKLSFINIFGILIIIIGITLTAHNRAN